MQSTLPMTPGPKGPHCEGHRDHGDLKEPGSSGSNPSSPVSWPCHAGKLTPCSETQFSYL